MLIREDIVRIAESVIKDLRLELERTDFTDPNRRTVVLKYNGTVIDSVTFDIKDQREYEG